MNTKKYHLYIFLFSVIILSAVIFYQVKTSFAISGGENYIYPLDDTYIHLSVAKHLANQGIWGIGDVFAGASSSPLYTLLLALMLKIFGNHNFTPVVLNFLFGIALLGVLYKIAQRYWGIFTYLGVGLATIFFPPLCGMIILGMEHTLHILLITSLLYKIISFEENNKTAYFYLFFLTIACVGARYESLFFVAVFFLYLIFQKLYKAGFLLGIAASIPVFLYGIFAVSQGGNFLPNALLVKGVQPELSFSGMIHFLEKGFFKMNHTAHVKALFDVLWIGFLGFFLLNFKKEKYIQFEKWHFALAAMCLTLVLHVCFADIGWFYRYEAYLIMLSLMVIFGSIEYYFAHFQSFSQIKKGFLIALSAVMILYACIPLFNRTQKYFTNTPIAMQNIYQQQYQMAKFVQTYYNDKGVMLGDIGAVSYFSDAKVLDMVGLGNNELLKRKKTQTLNQILTDMTQKQQTEIAIVYKKYFQNDMPQNWVEVGSWTISNNFVCGDSTVNFYAADSVKAKILVKNMNEYAKKMPNAIKVVYK